jgi:hypothetical protein
MRLVAAERFMIARSPINLPLKSGENGEAKPATAKAVHAVVSESYCPSSRQVFIALFPLSGSIHE